MIVRQMLHQRDILCVCRFILGRIFVKELSDHFRVFLKLISEVLNRKNAAGCQIGNTSSFCIVIDSYKARMSFHKLGGLFNLYVLPVGDKAPGHNRQLICGIQNRPTVKTSNQMFDHMLVTHLFY